MISMYQTAYITFEDDGQTLVGATIQLHSHFSFKSSADIYIHNPPMSIDDVTTSGQNVSINVKGDFMAKAYDFMMYPDTDQPYKIAEVKRESELLRNMLFSAVGLNTADKNTYFIEIQPNIDIAFICLCAYALDEMFAEA